MECLPPQFFSKTIWCIFQASCRLLWLTPTAQADGCTALAMATMLNKTAVVKVLVAAYVAKGLGVDHRTVSGDGWISAIGSVSAKTTAE